MTLRLLGAAVVAWIVFATQSPARTWTDSTGKHTIEADLIEVRDGMVRLKKENGNVITVPVEKLSEEDRKFLKEEEAKSDDGMPKTVTVDKLAGKPKELANDDGKPAGQKSFPRGHASAFDAPEGTWYLTSVRIHAQRYGYPAPPKEDFHVTLCDEEFHKIADFALPYSKFPYAKSTWVTLKLKPTKVPKRFVLCLNFNAQQTKGVYVSHDAEGESLVGLPEKHAGSFTGGDWLIRPSLDQLKEPPKAKPEKPKAEPEKPQARISIEGPFKEFGSVSLENLDVPKEAQALRPIRMKLEGSLRDVDRAFIAFTFNGDEDPDRVLKVEAVARDRQGKIIARTAETFHDPRIEAKKPQPLGLEVLPQADISLRLPKGKLLTEVRAIDLYVDEKTNGG